jgi:hypothetical protein
MLIYAENWTENLSRIRGLQDLIIKIWDVLELAIGRK